MGQSTTAKGERRNLLREFFDSILTKLVEVDSDRAADVPTVSSPEYVEPARYKKPRREIDLRSP